MAQIILLGASMFAAIGVTGYLVGIPDGVMFTAWLALGICYHVVFGSGLVFRDRAKRGRVHEHQRNLRFALAAALELTLRAEPLPRSLA